MTTGTFDYYVLYKETTGKQPGGLIASQEEPRQPLRAVVWSWDHDAWIYAPAMAATRLYDDRFEDTFETINRQLAEQIALKHLGATLPDEDSLRQICLKGQRLR